MSPHTRLARHLDSARNELVRIQPPRAVGLCECLSKDREVLLSSYDFPAEHWAHPRTTNPIESTFSTIRLRHRRTKGSGTRRTSLAMMFSSLRRPRSAGDASTATSRSLTSSKAEPSSTEPCRTPPDQQTQNTAFDSSSRAAGSSRSCGGRRGPRGSSSCRSAGWWSAPSPGSLSIAGCARITSTCPSRARP